MQQKIEWFQEVLSLEPGSRVFFPLAKLFVQVGDRENAVVTLTTGLERHPEYLEARILLVQVLSDLERTEEALEHASRIVDALSAYPAFWKIWAQGQSDEKRDFGVFLMLVASWLQGRPVHWTDIMLEGVNSLSERLVGPLPQSKPQAEPKASTSDESSSDSMFPSFEEEGLQRSVPAAGGLRTRTMADLLAAQGDYQGALDIFQDLLGRAAGDERELLMRRVQAMEAELAHQQTAPPAEDAVEEDVFSQHAKNRLIGALETLAARFEARVRHDDAGQ